MLSKKVSRIDLWSVRKLRSPFKIVQLLFLRKPDAEQKKGIESYRAIALTSVMSTLYATCIALAAGDRERAGGIEAVPCWRYQLPASAGDDETPTAEILRMAGGPKEKMSGMEVRGPTMYVVPSMDVKTASDVAKPRRIAKIVDGQGAHGWLVAASRNEELAGKRHFRKCGMQLPVR